MRQELSWTPETYPMGKQPPTPFSWYLLFGGSGAWKLNDVIKKYELALERWLSREGCLPQSLVTHLQA